MMDDDEEASPAPDDTAEHEGAEAKKDPGHDDDELLRKLKAWETRSRSHYSKWRQEAKRCYAFVSGDQWSSDDKSALLEQMRQPIVFNRTGPMVDAVCGAEILNRQEVRYVPREIGDVQTNEIISSASEWARDQCDAEDEESDAFGDTIICGMGWTETRMDYEMDPEGLIRIDRVDPFEMWSDPQAKKRNLADARFHFRAQWRDRDELPDAWKKKIGEGETGSGDLEDATQGESGPGDDYERGSDETGSSGDKGGKRRVWIKHFQWWELEDGFKLSDPQTGRIATMDPDQFKSVVKMYLSNGMPPPESAKLKMRKYYEAFVAGDVVLEKKPIACNAFTFHCVTGKRDRNTNTWYGIVRAMIDPQMWANKWLSQILHILNTSAKGGLLYEKGAVENPRKLLEDWAKPDSAIELQTGALGRGAVKERAPANYPQGLDRLLEFAVGSMPQVTGINLELLGLVQKDQPGVLEAQRKQAGYAILAVFFDSLRRYRKMQGRVMLHYIQHYLSDGRLIRIMGENGNEQYVPLVRQNDTATYDVIVDEAPMSPNQKEAVWGMVMQMAPMLMKQGLPSAVWSEVLKYSPLPSNVSSKISTALQEAGQPDPQAQQVQQMGQQLAMRKEAAVASKDETQAMLNEARAHQAMQPPAPPTFQ
jgi:hypothetical protein